MALIALSSTTSTSCGKFDAELKHGKNAQKAVLSYMHCHAHGKGFLGAGSRTHEGHRLFARCKSSVGVDYGKDIDYESTMDLKYGCFPAW